MPGARRPSRPRIRRWPLARVALYGFAGLILIFALYIVFGSDSGMLRILSLKHERDRLEQEVQRLEAEREELKQQIDQLEEADPFIIESEARRKGMVREGEKVYRLRYEEVPESTVARDSAPLEGE